MSTCRHCGRHLDLSFIDLGTAPPSNAYVGADALVTAEMWYPLQVLVCERCWLVQTRDYADRESLFTDDYAYFSSFSKSWLEHAENFVAKITARLGLDNRDLVIEVAANDGYLLQFLTKRGIPNFGIEPTAATARAARAKGVEIVEEFFGRTMAQKLRQERGAASLLIANNVLAHVPDINDFVAGFAVLLRSDGVATFEFPHLLQLVRQNQFDTIYHEHYSYLSLTSVRTIFAANGLGIFDLEEVPTHGGSLRLYAQRLADGPRPVTNRVSELLRLEQDEGICDPDFYRSLQGAAIRIKHDLLSYLLSAKQRGLTVAAYGAAAKGNTLLNFAGVRGDLLDFVADRNPAKQGRFLPGCRIPIVPEEQILLRRPDRILILPWNLADEICSQLHYVESWGCRLVTAIPRLAELNGART